MNNKSSKTRLSTLVLLILLVPLLSTHAASLKDDDILWVGSIISADGKTMIKTSYMDAPGDMVHIGFFDPDGKERTVIAGRHKMYDLAFSFDGYCLISGYLVGQNGEYLSLYSPKGKLLWEMPTEGASAQHLLVAKGSCRSFAAVRPILLDSDTSDEIYAINKDGSVFKKVQLNKEIYVYWQELVWDESVLLVVATDGVIAYDADNMRQLWRTEKMEMGVFRDLAVSTDKAYIALIEGMQIKEAGRVKGLQPHLIIIDAKTGKTRVKKVLQLDYRSLQTDPILFDQKYKSFVMKTKQGQFKVSLNGELEKIPEKH